MMVEKPLGGGTGLEPAFRLVAASCPAGRAVAVAVFMFSDRLRSATWIFLGLLLLLRQGPSRSM